MILLSSFLKACNWTRERGIDVGLVKHRSSIRFNVESREKRDTGIKGSKK
jgi:hypothetical protein